MTYSLAIDTATDVCSVAVFGDDKLLCGRVSPDMRNHASCLSPMIRDVLADCGVVPDRVILSEGPGSYTGLRIGASTAKGLCFGWDIPFVPISTLQLICAGVENAENALLCPMIDARRMEVYAALFTPSLHRIGDVNPVIIDSGSFHDELERGVVIFAGNGSGKCQNVISHPNARFAPDVVPLAQNAIKALKADKDAQPLMGTKMAYYEPFYLKEFQTTVSKKRL
ncbi:MAG: tRNA (adenosine(37)-N6)-threonylcarbamoyltransferase complex dimerization subunit type 1 TsaB [Paludibacteraceae bacterium]|nr:tRNA (adenosine(37)-N6)-threonylcarbamoyltransferase complex dimerization subunit type 1 TsaB [Paludibacteraceae bacterium]